MPMANAINGAQSARQGNADSWIIVGYWLIHFVAQQSLVVGMTFARGKGKEY
jgi:hypothetical protein